MKSKDIETESNYKQWLYYFADNNACSFRLSKTNPGIEKQQIFDM